ncbi:MAG: tRNA (adenosine(37)-N6)-threonylcarbamoyltransferase complex dimerization subunit type 1 TsaB [Fusobacteria bacterium]|nr:tRNA (adenosine(37)-N6)-threonylcarbamoyltransferase complex dimerization subunit type 1 TsaB [Fusobacteriota bacterium]
MLVLGIESSHSIASVAIIGENRVIGEMTFQADKNHSVILAPMVADILKYSKLTLKDLTAIGVDSGPGSFTGIRIGVSLAASLAYGGDLPLVKVSSLEALSVLDFKHDADAVVIPLIHGRKNEYYTSVDGQEKVVVLEDFLSGLDRAKKYLLLGDVDKSLIDSLCIKGLNIEILDNNKAGSTGVKVARKAIELYLAGNFSLATEAKANYLRRPEIDIKLDGKNVQD